MLALGGKPAAVRAAALDCYLKDRLKDEWTRTPRTAVDASLQQPENIGPPLVGGPILIILSPSRVAHYLLRLTQPVLLLSVLAHAVTPS